jgi:hypothetical protein
VLCHSNPAILPPATSVGFEPDAHRDLEHDPEKWNRFSEQIMLKHGDKIMIRFNPIGS